MDLVPPQKNKAPPPPPPRKPSHLQATSKPLSHASPPPSSIEKRGLAWPWNNPPTHFPLYTSYPALTWLYNWELWLPPSSPPSLEYVPQVRTAKEAPQIDQFLSSLWANQKAEGEPRHFLGFNEPDIADQANLTAAEAVKLWKAHIQPARAKFNFRLGAPAVSSAPQGRIWLRDFFDHIGVEGRDGVDFLNLHWYGTDVVEMEGYVRSMHEEFKRKVWVTEFACTRMGAGEVSGEEVEGFLKESVRMLEALCFVERYAYFGAMTDVGEWVGRANGFVNEKVKGEPGLSRVGKLYCELDC